MLRKKGILRGVNKSMMDDSLKKPLHLMPEHRRSFWEIHIEKKESDDLSINLEHLKNN